MKTISDTRIETIDALEMFNGQNQNMLRFGDLVVTWDGDFEYYDFTGIPEKQTDHAKIDWEARAIDREAADQLVQASNEKNSTSPHLGR